MTQDGDYYGLASDGTSVWVYNGETGALVRISAASGSAVATMMLGKGCGPGRGCGNLAISPGSLWVANDADGTVTKVDSSTNKVVATIEFGPKAGPQVYSTAGSVWVAEYFGGTYSRIDPSTNRVTRQITGHDGAETVISAAGSIWFCDAGSPGLTRLDPTTLQAQAQVDLTAGGTQYVCFDTAPVGGAVWVAAVSDGGGLLERVDAASGQVAATSPPPGRHGVERGVVSFANGLWMVDSELGVFRLDPTTGRAAARAPLSGALSITSDGAAVWVVTRAGSLARITPAPA